MAGEVDKARAIQNSWTGKPGPSRSFRGQGKESGFYPKWMKSQPLDSFEWGSEIITHTAVGKMFRDSRSDIENMYNGVLFSLKKKKGNSAIFYGVGYYGK